MIWYKVQVSPHDFRSIGPVRRPARWPWWVLACALLALAQVQWAGYQIGVGNQTVQVPFLERMHDPSLFPRDEMVQRTLDRYPTLFFPLLAPALRWVRFENLYLALHLLTAAAALAGAVALVRVMIGSAGAAWLTVLFLLAGHHHALADQTLYSNGFTHTWAVFPWLLAALVCWYAGRHRTAFILTGLLMNLHALEAGQLAVVLCFWALGNIRRLGWRRVAGLVGLLLVFAAPTLWMLARHPQSFDAQWLEWTRLRSALHSFPSAWWRSGDASVPRYAVLLALAALSWSWLPAGNARRQTVWFAAGTGLLWIVGTVFTEVWPQPVVVRAQLFRSSRLLAVVALAWIAAGCVRAWALPFAGERKLPQWRAWLEFANATLLALVLAWPAAVLLLPVALVATTVVALANGRLSWLQAAVAGGAVMICLAAWQTIQFVVPGASPGFSLSAAIAGSGPGGWGCGLVAAAAVLWWMAARSGRSGRTAIAAVVGAVMGIAGLARFWPGWRAGGGTDAGWWMAQRWARQNTPVDALFLTPVQTGGFRILSQRSVVGEWRDGTQLYFCAAFGPVWWERMNALQPGMRAAPDGQRLLVRGRSLEDQTDEDVIALAKRYGATHLALPVDANRRLTVLYTNAVWGIYRPAIAPPPVATAADELKQAAFLREVVEPNIDKNRKSAARVQVMGADGRPLYDAGYRIGQTNSLFRFGVSLPPFLPAGEGAVPPHTLRPPPLSAAQLDRVRDVFNFSVIAESAWWSNLEPHEGQPRFDDLEKYLAWCRAQGWVTEFSFLSGFPPGWWYDKPAAEQVLQFQRHALDLVDRFGALVDYWQATNRGLMLEAATNVMARLREKLPGIQLGLSDAARFASPRLPPRREADLDRGLEDLRRLKEQGVVVDYVALHGHEPWGMRADARTMYEVLDAFAKEGVPIHITEFAAPAAGPMEGGGQRGAWDPAEQAGYCRLAYTVLFSHPAVTAINYAELGPVTRLADAGLIGPDGRPRPAYEALRELILHRWRTRVQGRLPLDGRIQFRGFHGDYQLQVTLKNGKTARAMFRVAPGQENDFRFRFDTATGRLVPVP